MKKYFEQSIYLSSKTLSSIAILLLLGIASSSVQAQKGSFYIFDTIDMDAIGDYDKALMDSCLKVYHSSNAVEKKLEAMGFLVYELDDHNLGEKYAKWFLETNVEFINKIHDDSLVLRSIYHLYITIGHTNWLNGNASEALLFSKKAYDVIKKTNDKSGLAQVFNNISAALCDLGNDDEAIDYLFEALKIHEELKDTNGLALVYHNIAYRFHKIENYKPALEFYQKSYTYYLMLDDEEELGMTFNNIGLVYFNMGIMDSAMHYYNMALDIYTKYNKESGISAAVSNMGKIYQHKGAYENALRSFEMSLDIDKRLGFKRDVCITLNNIGYIYTLTKNYNKSIDYSLQSMEIAKENNYLSSIKYAAENLSIAYENTKDFEKALYYFKLFKDYSDSTSKAETQRKFAEFTMKYEFYEQMKSDSIYQLELERIEKEALAEEQLIRERRDNLQYSGILILFLILFVFVSYGNKINLPSHLIRGMIFLGILMFFEFILVLLDPYIESISDNAPGIKLALNASIASVFFPIHRLLEVISKEKLIKKRQI